MPDWVDKGIKELPITVTAFNKLLKKKRFILAKKNDIKDQATNKSSINQLIKLNIVVNEAVDEIFSFLHETSSLNSSLVDIYI